MAYWPPVHYWDGLNFLENHDKELRDTALVKIPVCMQTARRMLCSNIALPIQKLSVLVCDIRLDAAATTSGMCTYSTSMVTWTWQRCICENRCPWILRRQIHSTIWATCFTRQVIMQCIFHFDNISRDHRFLVASLTSMSDNFIELESCTYLGFLLVHTHQYQQLPCMTPVM